MNRLLLTLLAAMALWIPARAGVWDVTTPLNIDPISQGDDRIREMKSALQEALRGGATDGEEAIFPGASPTTAPIFRYRGLKGSTAGRPAASAGGLYFNTTTGTIQRSSYTATDTGAGWEDITENAAYEAIHQKVASALASSLGVVTLPETGNSFNVSGTEAITSISGWSAGVVIIKWTQARTLTHGTNFYLMEALPRTVAANDISIFEFTGANAVREIAFLGARLMPTRQTFLSGTAQTYTTPAGARQLRIRMVGGGGGGAALINNSGTAGGDTSFNSIVAKGGAGGALNFADGGAGGDGGSGSASLRISGGSGGNAPYGSGAYFAAGGPGGVSVFGGAGPQGRGSGGYSPGIAAKTNSGSGGGGATSYGSDSPGAGGGGAGEYVEIVINVPSATYTYTVGAKGTGGAAGNAAGGDGGAGIIIVDELY